MKKIVRITVLSVVCFAVLGIGTKFYYNNEAKIQRTSYLGLKKALRSISASSRLIIDEAYASTNLVDSLSGQVRFFYFMIAGFPGISESASELVVTDDTVFRALNSCPTGTIDACDAPPAAGMLSLYNQIILGYQDSTWTGVAGVMSAQGYTTCSSIPTTTTVIVPANTSTGNGGTATVTAAPSEVVIPTGHTGADGTTTYDRRIEVTMTDSDGTSKFLVELNCSTAAQITAGKIQLYTGVSFPEGDSTRIIEFYADKMDLDAQQFDFFMDYQSSATSSQNMVLSMDINATSGNLDFDMIMANQNGATDFDAFKMNVIGNVDEDDFTVGYQRITGKTTFANVAAGTNASSVAVTADYDHTANGAVPEEGDYIVFCLEGNGSGTYVGPDDGADMTAGSACAGYALSSNAAAPAIDSGGAFSIQWVAHATTGLDAAIWDGSF